MQSIILMEMTLLASGVYSISLISTLFDQGNWRWWLLHQAPAPEMFGCTVYRHKTTFPLVWTITLNTS